LWEGAQGFGYVVWFNKFKGYDFIRPDAGGKDVFVHMSAVEEAGISTLIEGQRVSYELVSVAGKVTASQLRVGIPESKQRTD
jgi:cold shock protein